MIKGIDDLFAVGGGSKLHPIKNIGELLDLLKALGAKEPEKQNSQVEPPTTFLPSTGGIRPPIIINNRQLIDVIDDSWLAIHESNQPEPRVFHGFNALVRLIKKQPVVGWPEVYEIELMNVDQMYGRLLRSAVWLVRKKNDNGGWREVDSKPPKDAAKDMLAFPDIERLPRLESIVSSPRYNSNGLLIMEPGYHLEEALFFDPRGQLNFQVPVNPSEQDVIDAKKLIFEIVCDFPFLQESDKVHAISRPITFYVRKMIKGPTPLHLVEAETPGTGKGLLEKILALIITGRVPEITTLPSKEEEIKKTITSTLIKGADLVNLDNADDKEILHSPNLAAVLTSEVWTDRILGLSQMVSVPNMVIWSYTGNNVKLSKELTRRCLRTRLEAESDQPWLRQESEFRYPDLPQYVLENRSKFVQAYLVLIENWKAKGCPKGKKKLGSYESYSEIVGGILGAADISGFLDDLQDFYEVADVEGKMWREFVLAWLDHNKGAALKVSVISKFCQEEGLMFQVRGTGTEQSQVTKLGLALKTKTSKTIGNYILRSEKSNKKGTSYSLELKNLVGHTAVSSRADQGTHNSPTTNSSTKTESCVREGDLSDLSESYSIYEEGKTLSTPLVQEPVTVEKVRNVRPNQVSNGNNIESNVGPFNSKVHEVSDGPRSSGLSQEDFDAI